MQFVEVFIILMYIKFKTKQMAGKTIQEIQNESNPSQNRIGQHAPTP